MLQRQLLMLRQVRFLQRHNVRPIIRIPLRDRLRRIMTGLTVFTKPSMSLVQPWRSCSCQLLLTMEALTRMWPTVMLMVLRLTTLKLMTGQSMKVSQQVVPCHLPKGSLIQVTFLWPCWNKRWETKFGLTTYLFTNLVFQPVLGWLVSLQGLSLETLLI